MSYIEAKQMGVGYFKFRIVIPIYLLRSDIDEKTSPYQKQIKIRTVSASGYLDYKRQQ